MTDVLQRLLDTEAIRHVLHQYCRACDRGDETLMRAVFHADSAHRHGGFSGRSQDFVTFAMGIIGKASITKHMLTNITIEIQGGHAHSESHYSAFHRGINSRTGREEDQFSGGRYIDTFERRNGAWRIVARIGLIDYERFLEPADRNLAQLPSDARSRKSLDDAIYTQLGIERARRIG